MQENKLDHHEHLYQEALQRRERAINYAQWIPEDCTFHPQISARHSAPSDLGLSLLERCCADHATLKHSLVLHHAPPAVGAAHVCMPCELSAVALQCCIDPYMLHLWHESCSPVHSPPRQSVSQCTGQCLGFCRGKLGHESLQPLHVNLNTVPPRSMGK